MNRRAGDDDGHLAMKVEKTACQYPAFTGLQLTSELRMWWGIARATSYRPRSSVGQLQTKVWFAAEDSPLPRHLDSHSPVIDMLYRDRSYERSIADPGRNSVWTFHVAIRTLCLRFIDIGPYPFAGRGQAEVRLCGSVRWILVSFLLGLDFSRVGC